MSPERKYLNVKEVASRLEVSKMTVYRLVERKELASIRVGRSIRVLADSLAAYEEQ